MMYHEFTERTGFYPTMDLYRAIESAYLASGQSKDDFCAAYREDRDGLATGIAHEAEMAAFRAAERETRRQRSDMEQLRRENEEQAQRIRELEARLEREREWKPQPLDSAMDQADYERLAADPSARRLTTEEAADLIAKAFGFDREKIGIVRQLKRLEIDRHRSLRVVGSVQRDPLFDAWDWNYVAFKVQGSATLLCEMVNGELHLR